MEWTARGRIESCGARVEVLAGSVFAEANRYDWLWEKNCSRRAMYKMRRMMMGCVNGREAWMAEKWWI